MNPHPDSEGILIYLLYVRQRIEPSKAPNKKVTKGEMHVGCADLASSSIDSSATSAALDPSQAAFDSSRRKL